MWTWRFDHEGEYPFLGSCFSRFNFLPPPSDAWNGVVYSASAGNVVASDVSVRGIDSPNRLAGSYIVIFNSSPPAPRTPLDLADNQEQIVSTIGQLAHDIGGRIGHVYSAAVHGFSVHELEEDEAFRLAGSPLVEYVEADLIATPDNGGTQFVNVGGGLWGLDRIDQQTMPLDGLYHYPNMGYWNYGHEVYVMDSGIYAGHSDLSGRVLGGYNSVSENSDTDDCFGHGTHVAGTIGGSAVGVAKAARIIPVRISEDCDHGVAQTSAVVDAVDWVASHRLSQMWVSWSQAGTAVVNFSYSIHKDTNTQPPPQAVTDAFENLAAFGDDYRLFIVVAAGNLDADACDRHPGVSDELMTVGAVALSDGGDHAMVRRWKEFEGLGSNWGKCVDIFAPGAGVMSANFEGGSVTKSGTSMATPHVAGAALMYIYENPYATRLQIFNALIANSVQSQIDTSNDGKWGDSPNRLLNIEFIQ